MKTAMQQLIEVVKKRHDFIEDNGYKEAMGDVLLIGLNLLKAEKEQIIEAYEAGTKEDLFNTWRIPEEVYKKEKSAEYFQQTFKQDE